MNTAPEQTVPGIVRVINVITVEKNWPLIPRYCQFTTAKLFLDPTGHKNYAEKNKKRAYSTSDQSKPAGHNKAPVHS